MTRVLLVAAVLAAGVATVAHGADANQATLPPALSKVDAIRAIFPRLYRNEMARKDKRSWERLRRAARTKWMRSHPCSDATLNRRYELGASSWWGTVEATWACEGLSSAKRAFLRCIPRFEGGYSHPDVRFGGARGYPGGHGNVVFGPWQVRPAWFRGAMEGRPGVYAGDHWTYDLYLWALHPVNQARTVAFIGESQYATRSLCS